MARRQWPPSRARLHFGDFAPPRPEPVLSDDTANKGVRTIGDVVWTAVREDAFQVTLCDGRQLLVGGEVSDYGDEYADPWVYNDIIVTHADGTVEILTYPKEVFPALHWPTGVAVDDSVYIFGIASRELHPHRSRAPVVLKLDVSSYAISELTAADPPVRVNIHAGAAIRQGNRIVFATTRERKTDPHLLIAFDVQTAAWGKPYPREQKRF